MVELDGLDQKHPNVKLGWSSGGGVLTSCEIAGGSEAEKYKANSKYYYPAWMEIMREQAIHCSFVTEQDKIINFTQFKKTSRHNFAKKNEVQIIQEKGC